MEYIKLLYNRDFYSYDDSNSIKMTILGDFLTSDVIRPKSFKEWALNKESDYICLNITILEKKNDCILLKDYFSEEDIPTVLKLTCNQFMQLLDDWEEKVCKQKPQEVIIKYENNEFIFETKN